MASPAATLAAVLKRLDGRSYSAYRDLRGDYELGPCRLRIDHVQSDPFAPPSQVRLWVPIGLTVKREDRTAAEDWLLRRAGDLVRHLQPTGGSGSSGRVEILEPGPEIMERSALRLHRDGTAEVRLGVGLPARGRRILGPAAQTLLLRSLPELATALVETRGIEAHLHSARVQRALRDALGPAGLVAFVADGSILPRASGVSERPLGNARATRAPDSLAVELDTPWGRVRGLGIPRGVTAIVGGGFHGKSTLLDALAWGHLNHVPGDGRERVVCVPDTVKVRAEDGRPIASVDISGFLSDLPNATDTAAFSTPDASGSTSQAAGIVEAIESGARVLLFDEDTSATNLMVRDPRMQAVVPSEPIVPLVQSIRSLAANHDVSTVIVIGGIADYLGAADTVILLDRYALADAGAAARSLGIQVDTRTLPPPRPRVFESLPNIDKVRARDTRSVRVGDGEIALDAVEQVVSAAHATSIGHAARFVGEHLLDGRRTLRQALDALDAILDDEGVEALSPRPWPSGRLVRPRRHDVAAALNRLRGARVRQA